MIAIFDKTSTASSVVFSSRVSTADIPRVHLLSMPIYKDLGTEGSNKPCASVWDLQQAKPGFLKPIDLGWSKQETLETKAKFAAFEEDWNAPGMEAYDSL